MTRISHKRGPPEASPPPGSIHTDPPDQDRKQSPRIHESIAPLIR